MVDQWTCVCFEWPNVMIILDRDFDRYSNAIMRCTTNLVMVEEEKSFDEQLAEDPGALFAAILPEKVTFVDPQNAGTPRIQSGHKTLIISDEHILELNF